MAQLTPLCLLLMHLVFSITGIHCQHHTYDYGYPQNIIHYTRQVHIKQGVLQGVVVESRINRDLHPVEQYLGIPYAAPPVKELRFMPPGSAPSWPGTKYADTFGPVCPQKLPDRNTMGPERGDYYDKLLKHLILNQSEDCLYLNIYAPVQELSTPVPMYPVIVFLHGESYEWNSGNPYDGSVLASYGRVIVITLNFRLGVFGFLQTGVEQSSASNFGLVDQVAALVWIQDNIAAFGGDPSLVTLLGHGTGAVCSNLLMLSPMVVREHNKLLFHRAILMGGSALADWAMQEKPRQVTSQIADSLKCPPNEAELSGCLRNRNSDDILNAPITMEDYVTNLGPIIDSRIIPNSPQQIMAKYTEQFKRFELMYGVTEVESAHMLGPVALTHGVLMKERDMELLKYMRKHCEVKHELCKERAFTQYNIHDTDDQPFDNSNRPAFDKAKLARDELLDMLSDARSLSAIVQTAKFHAAVNAQSYFYVFGHTSSAKQHLRTRSIHGDELPYVFGVPLDGPKFHYTDQYTAHEKLLSEVIMTYFTNFAYFGNPNVPRRSQFLTLNAIDWLQFDVEWPEYNIQEESYLYLAIPPQVRYQYRSKEVDFWNNLLPDLLRNTTAPNKSVTKKPKSIPPWVHPKPFDNFRPTKPTQEVYGTIKFKPHPTSDPADRELGIVVTPEPGSDTKSGNGTNLLVVIGCLFLLINIVIFIALYYKCIRLKNKEQNQHEQYQDASGGGVDQKSPEHNLPLDGCNLIRLIGKSDKNEDIYRAVRVSEDGSNQRYKLTRQTSSSTIDAHTKVREWIAHEIVQRCSPGFLRRTRHQLAEEYKNIQQKHTDPAVPEAAATTGSNLTIGQTPTRPVSPEDVANCENINEIGAPNANRILLGNTTQKNSKISVAVDATPAGRGISVLRQKPAELTRSGDISSIELPLSLEAQRSATLDDGRCRRKVEATVDIIDGQHTKVKGIEVCPILKIHHAHSKSDPVQDLLNEKGSTDLRSFNPDQSINVTCKEEPDKTVIPLTAEQQLQLIKRRNFPKVLPDYPGERRGAASKKRLSMPVPGYMHAPVLDIPLTQLTSPFGKLSNRLPPPAPPPRTTSSLARRPGNTRICTPAALAEEPPSPIEPELTFNNLYIGPLIPSTPSTKKSESTSDLYKQNIQQIYGHLRPAKSVESEVPEKREPKTIISADLDHPIKRTEPKVIIKPTVPKKTFDSVPRIGARVLARNSSDENYNISNSEKDQNTESAHPQTQEDKCALDTTPQRPSQIPTLIKVSSCPLKKESSSSESSPSEQSDTGTIINRT